MTDEFVRMTLDRRKEEHAAYLVGEAGSIETQEVRDNALRFNSGVLEQLWLCKVFAADNGVYVRRGELLDVVPQWRPVPEKED